MQPLIQGPDEQALLATPFSFCFNDDEGHRQDMTDTTYSDFEEIAQDAPLAERNTPPVPGGFEPIKFTGRAGAYFSIWIVNVILTIITVGIYESWAKVRRISYFYNNTTIRSASFVYHATGLQLFKGRLIAFVILLVFGVVQYVFPPISILFSLLILIAMPYLLNKSLRFKARMTSWRNVRLDWHGTYWKTLWFFIVAPVLGIMTLGILTPLMTRNYYRYFATRHTFGTTPFKADLRASRYYSAFALGFIAPYTIGLILITATIALFMPITDGLSSLDASSREFLVSQLPLGLVLLVYIVDMIYSIMCRNILLRSLQLGADADFHSTLNPWKWAWINISNFVATICTLGLLTPWAAIRRYRYLAQNTHYRFLTDEHQFTDRKREEMSAFGEEFADFEGWEISV